MFQLPKSILSFGAGAVALGILVLTAPRAAHALNATLVQMTNTVADPAITQGTNTLASQQVLLMLPVNGYLDPTFGLVAMQEFTLPAGVAPEQYQVPAGHELVITGIDLNVGSPGVYFSLYLPINGGGNWATSNAQLPGGFQQIRYPSGIVVPAGSNVYTATIYSGSAADVLVHGYLTAN